MVVWQYQTMYAFFSPLLVVFIYLFPLLWNQSQWYRSPFTPSTALSSWFLTCGLTSTSLWRRMPGCRNALRSWKRSETSCAVSWTASSSAWGVQTVRGADLQKKKKKKLYVSADFSLIQLLLNSVADWSGDTSGSTFKPLGFIYPSDRWFTD